MMESNSKPKAIIFVRTDFCPMKKYIEMMQSLGIDSLLEVKYIYSNPEKFDPKPFPLTENIEILGLFGMTGLEQKLLENYKNTIKWIHSFPAGVDKLLLKKEIQDSKAILTNGRGAYKIQMAEFISFAILWYCNNCEFWLSNKENKLWKKHQLPSLLLKNFTLGKNFRFLFSLNFFFKKFLNFYKGIFGFGDIGISCAKIVKEGFGMKVLGLKRDPNNVSNEAKKYSDEILNSENPEDMKKILENSDFIVNCLPLTKSTEKLFDSEKFKLMKKSACFINVGRGLSVVEADLIEALETKEIAAACLDVFEKEPLDEENPLWEFENVFITPHSCELTHDSIKGRLEVFIDNVKNWIDGENLNYIVDRKKGY